MFSRGLVTVLLSLIALGTLRAQRPVGIAYYDLDRLYDTVPSPFYHDDDYTPDGRMHWNTARYNLKIRNTTAVVDSMRLPIVALAGVENEQVVRDIVRTSANDYSYIHRTLNALDGMDFALLYYGDLFVPDYDETGRNYLYIEGELLLPGSRPGTDSAPARRERVGLLLTTDTRMAARVVDDLREERPGVRIVVLGRAWSVDCARHGLHDALERADRAGRGNVRSRGGWLMRDRILTDTTLHAEGGDVFARRYLVDTKSGYPLPTYDRLVYKGGFSYALPVFVYVR